MTAAAKQIFVGSQDNTVIFEHIVHVNRISVAGKVLRRCKKAALDFLLRYQT